MEISELGWNVFTVGFIGAIAVTFPEAWGAWRQVNSIWKNRSGESVSVTWFSYSTALFIIVCIYGASIGSIALLFNGAVLGFLHFPIVAGLWKFKGFTKRELVWSIVFLISIVITFFVSFKDWMFLIVTSGNVLFSLAQPYEIWKNRDSGVVEIRLILFYLMSSFFWGIYGFMLDNWVIKIISPAYAVVLFLTAAVWFRYRRFSAPRRRTSITTTKTPLP